VQYGVQTMSMGWELFQHTEEAGCGVLEPNLTAERKVSFEFARI